MATMLAEVVKPDNPTKVGFSAAGVRSTLTAMPHRQRARNRCRERLETLAGADLDADEARQETIVELRRVVGFERWCWPLTDPDSALSISGIGEVDFWPSLARLVSLEHGDDVTSKPSLLSGPRASVALSEATRGDLALSRRWRECLHPYGIGDELMTACRDRHGCWGTLELVRDSDDVPFTEDDQRLLHELAPTLGTLLRRGLVRGWQPTSEKTSPRPPGTLILDAELRPKSWTPPFREWLAELPSSGPDPNALPPAVYEIGARALAPPGAPDSLPDRVRIRAPGGRWLVIEGAPLEGTVPRQVAITVRAATPDEVFDILCRAHDLTRRERELVTLMLGGLATEQLARALYISPYTVKDHFKAIFAKTGIRSRHELISHLTGHDSIPASRR
jgi:DNA-binding CsgD family transcriptional regulator